MFHIHIAQLAILYICAFVCVCVLIFKFLERSPEDKTIPANALNSRGQPFKTDRPTLGFSLTTSLTQGLES